MFADQQALKSYNPWLIFMHFWRLRNLIAILTRREIIGRYKGSLLGAGWSVVQPVIMLCVYTFVFSVIFEARWGIQSESKAMFALALFIGLITYGLFSEVANSAPYLVLTNVNYVKKTVFPLEILPLVRMLSVLFNALLSLAVLFVGVLWVNHSIHLTVLLLPAIWLPMLFFSLGCGYFLASLGVFVRDIGPTIGMLTTMFFFLTPIFYPVEAVPEKFRFVVLFNPLAQFIEAARQVVLWGTIPDGLSFFTGLAGSFLIFLGGLAWFMKTKKAFADVI